MLMCALSKGAAELVYLLLPYLLCGQECRRAGAEVGCHRWATDRPLQRRGAPPSPAASQGVLYSPFPNDH
eukprot:scaffold22908_cov73-Phaeocystis_antarctica.AAC.1